MRTIASMKNAVMRAIRIGGEIQQIRRFGLPFLTQWDSSGEWCNGRSRQFLIL